MSKKLDGVGHFVVVLHELLGHRRAEAYLGEPERDMDDCIMCRRDRGEATEDDVIEQIGVEVP